MNISARISSKVGQLTVLATLALVGTAHAANTSLTTNNVKQSTTVNTEFGGSTATAANTTAGAFQVVDNTNTAFWVYCLDPLTAYQSSATYSTASLSDFMTLGGTSSSYNQLFTKTPYVNVNAAHVGAANAYTAQNTSTVLNKLTSLYSHAYADSLTSSTKSAAFQYAIWEIEGDASYSSTAGGLKTASTGAFKTQVDAYLAALTSNNWASVGGLDLRAVTNYTYTAYASNPLGGSQSFLRVTPSSTVPEPGSIALVSLALFGVAYTRRSKASKQD
ncbi:hypothetical protein HNP55_000309 [Paucibacter oligotrophus]|uniref:Ice-binding protein C-terminal domain-containing protein n=1 Tax=Roseateles oligotrophus TaxID=1769250 RepID=A0A840L068_9BURK|nr:PEP-CTERM sorting domain-containing protein [Roseateles oligotrophus]MBB4841814.1 hypothetical protein [Roseateles oligotrophus]